MEKTEYQLPHLGEMVKNVMQEKRISQAEVARKLGVGSSTVAHYLRQPSLHFGTLWKLCIALQHDFLADFQKHYPNTMPPKDTTAEQQKIKELEKEIAIYKAALRIGE